MNIVGEIRYYVGEGDYAVLKFSESKNAFSIDIVSVPSVHRNNGVGTHLINHVLLMADSMNKEVLVSARPIGVTNEDKLQQLIRFYEKFGFEVKDRGLTVAYMSRKAQK